MPLAAIQAYHRQLPALQAQLSLLLVATSGFPYLDEDRQREQMRRWRDALGEAAVPEPPSPAQLALIGIGVRRGR
jgi:hypothetical protein